MEAAIEEFAADVFGGAPKTKAVASDLKILHAKIGQLMLENNFLESVLNKAGLLLTKSRNPLRDKSLVELSERKTMIDRTDQLPIARQCQIFELARSTAYYQPAPVSPEEHGRRRVSTLMKRMGINALHHKPNTSKRHPVYPYLVRNLTITSSNQVWAVDITYIPMKRDFVY